MRLRWKRKPSQIQAKVWLSTVIEPCLRVGRCEEPTLRERVGGIGSDDYRANADQITRYLPAFAPIVRGQALADPASRVLLEKLRATLLKMDTCAHCGSRYPRDMRPVMSDAELRRRVKRATKA